MKILNLYAGIGGNRKLWGNEHDITAVEIVPEIAEVYKTFFPNDTVIVGDAHDYLLKHFKEFDFIWSSPPCPTHSRIRKLHTYAPSKDKPAQNEPVYPDMVLYQEILFLQHYFKGKWVVENVVPFYEPLIEAQSLGRHLIWANFKVPMRSFPHDNINETHDRRKRNAVNADLGLHVFNSAFKDKQVSL